MSIYLSRLSLSAMDNNGRDDLKSAPTTTKATCVKKSKWIKPIRHLPYSHKESEVWVVLWSEQLRRLACWQALDPFGLAWPWVEVGPYLYSKQVVNWTYQQRISVVWRRQQLQSWHGIYDLTLRLWVSKIWGYMNNGIIAEELKYLFSKRQE